MKTAPQELRTARLLLRSFEHSDIPAITLLAGAREVAITTAHIPHPYSAENARSFLRKTDEEFQAGLCAAFAICIPQEQLCGAIGLHLAPEHKRAELGYWVGVPFWGMGFATEAARAVVGYGFENLGLHRIHASYFAGNTRSKRVLEKVGMRHEGTSRQHLLRWGRFIDLENYGICEDEFRGKPEE